MLCVMIMCYVLWLCKACWTFSRISVTGLWWRHFCKRLWKGKVQAWVKKMHWLHTLKLIQIQKDPAVRACFRLNIILYWIIGFYFPVPGKLWSSIMYKTMTYCTCMTPLAAWLPNSSVVDLCAVWIFEIKLKYFPCSAFCIQIGGTGVIVDTQKYQKLQ